MHTSTGFISWFCPYCERYTTLRSEFEEDIAREPDIYHVKWEHLIKAASPDEGGKGLAIDVYVCPNPECKQETIIVGLYKKTKAIDKLDYKSCIDSWQLKPRSRARSYPEYIPEAIRKDYSEACVILHDSPKASAALARRCLQGIVRNFFQIQESTLYKELNAIQGQIDDKLWQAMDGVRKIGNIASHMKQEVDRIVEVEPHEAESMIGLIEIMLQETYIREHNKQQEIHRLQAIAKEKEQQDKNT